MRLRKGDEVKVVRGKDAGLVGKVSRVLPKDGKVIVEGANRAKKHQRPRGQTMQGGIIDKDMPIDVSNVMIMCPQDGPTRAGSRIDDTGDKHRVCVKCGGDL